jgi:hypothetical protein
VLLDIQLGIGQAANDVELKRLLNIHQGENADWAKIKNKYVYILQER